MANYVKNVTKKFDISKLYDNQKIVLDYLCTDKSVFVFQGVGMGKSLCYQAHTTAITH